MFLILYFYSFQFIFNLKQQKVPTYKYLFILHEK